MLEIFVFLISLLVISKLSEECVKSAMKLARITKLGGLAIGFIFLSVLTSLPEAAISLDSILLEHPNISLGNIFGSVVTNICFILAIAALYNPLTLREEPLQKILNMLVLTIAILFLFSTVPFSGRIISLILLFVFLCYCFYLTKEKITFKKLTRYSFLEAILRPIEIYKQTFKLIFSSLSVFLFSLILIEATGRLANKLGVHESILGATLIAIGSSLPELSTTFAALKKKEVSLALGNLIGSCLTDVSLVLGITMLARTLRLYEFFFLPFFALISSLSLWIFLVFTSRRRIDRAEASFLLILFIIFLICLSLGLK